MSFSFRFPITPFHTPHGHVSSQHAVSHSFTFALFGSFPFIPGIVFCHTVVLYAVCYFHAQFFSLLASPAHSFPAFGAFWLFAGFLRALIVERISPHSQACELKEPFHAISF